MRWQCICLFFEYTEQDTQTERERVERIQEKKNIETKKPLKKKVKKHTQTQKNRVRPLFRDIPTKQKRHEKTISLR